MMGAGGSVFVAVLFLIVFCYIQKKKPSLPSKNSRGNYAPLGDENLDDKTVNDQTVDDQTVDDQTVDDRTVDEV